MNKQYTKIQSKTALCVLASIAAASWSWLFLIDVTRLSESAAASYAVVVLVYLVIVGITTFITYRFWRVARQLLAKPSWTSLVQMLLLWAAAEFIIAWSVSIIWIGRGGSWDNVLPFFSLTPVITMTPLKFLTRIGGYYGTSAAVGVLILVMFYGKPWRQIAVRFGLVLVLTNVLMFALYSQVNGKEMNVMITSETLGSREKVDTSGADLVVLPEYGLNEYTSDNVADRFVTYDKEVYFSGTRQLVRDGKYHNLLVYGSTAEGYIDERHKSRLIPGGEYLAFHVEAVLKILAPNVYYNFQAQRAVERGNEKAAAFELPDGESLGNAACSSIINPEDYRKMTIDGSTLLANSASLEVFRGSRQFEIYHSGLARFMATSNARPFAQSANHWRAFVLNHNGQEIASLNPVGSEAVKVSTNNKNTPYTLVGEVVAYAGIALLAFKLFKKISKRFS